MNDALPNKKLGSKRLELLGNQDAIVKLTQIKLSVSCKNPSIHHTISVKAE